MKSQTLTITKAIDLAAQACGGLSALAANVGLAPNAPSMWKARGSVPAEHCAAVELACGGAVRRWHLRPHDWRRVWPELAAHPEAPRR